MKKFIKIFFKDKRTFKMINQTNNSFDLIVLDDFYSFINKLKSFDDDQIYVIWQMKFKRDSFMIFTDCVFNEPIDNLNTLDKRNPFIQGKRFHVTCRSVQYYSDFYENKNVPFTKSKFKPKKLIDRLLKISELNQISEETETV